MNWSSETWTAIATVVIAIFTIVLGLVGGVQAWLTRQAIKLGRDEFNATHRPRVKIRSISAPQEEGARAALFRFTVVNVGGTPANITGHTFQVIFHTGQEGVVLSLQDPDIVTEDVWLVSGDRHTFEHRTEWIDPGPDNSVIVTGEVTYTDGAEISRHTGFARVYDPNRGGYSVSEIYTEDEYED